jgi:branched-chain amino acid transport system substrate-binding protein
VIRAFNQTIPIDPPDEKGDITVKTRSLLHPGKLLLSIAITALACFTFFACSKNSAGPSGDAIVIGTVQPLSGPYAAFGVKFYQAYNMAADEINAAGGLNGRPIKIQFEDSQDKADLAQTAARKLVEDPKVLAIIGGRLSGAGMAIGQVAEQQQIPYLVDHPSADAITKAGFHWTFRMNPASSFNSVPLQRFLKAQASDIKKVALLYENTLYGKGVTEPFQSWLKENGYDIVVSDLYQPLSLDYRDLLNKVKAAEPDLLFLASNIPDSALIVRQTREQGIAPKLICGAGAGFSINEFYEQASAAANNVCSTGPWSGNPKDEKVKALSEKFFKNYGHYPKEHEAEGYVAVYVITDALKRAKSLSRSDIRDALQSTDMQTTFGPIKFEDFDGYTNQNNGLRNGQVVLSQWQNGKLVNIFPADIAEASAVYPGVYK